MDWQMELFRSLTEAAAAPGNEKPVREIMKKHLQESTEELIYDHLGGVFGVRKGKVGNPKVMVAGHMDEVGFMVTNVTDQGFIQFQTLGGWWSQVLLAQRVQIITEKGPIIGVIATIPPHLLSDDDYYRKPYDLNKLFIDIGADHKKEAEEFGVKQGQPILPLTPFTPLANPKKLLAKAWDNRYGCALAIEIARELKNEELSLNLYCGATVQEEVGLRGAEVAANLIQPDLFIALDASPASDVPGASEGFGKLGDGVLLRIMDRSMVTHQGFRDFLIDVAEEENIKYQYYVSTGGTDAGRVHLHGKGVPSIVIGIPARYIHTHASIIHHDDYEQAKKLALAVLKRINHDVLAKIRDR